jgi:ADP-L-glycero-D-manno-heptose 6-epimerase
VIVVTGGAGFIGSNLVAALCRDPGNAVVVVDDLSDGTKFSNLARSDIADYRDKEDFRAGLADGRSLEGVQAVFHQGACSDTTEWDGQFIMDVNFQYSKDLFHACQARGIPLIYASSAAVYGSSAHFREDPANECPINVYGYSKLLFDRYVARHRESGGAQVVGLRYFNVYGPNEEHKGRMASVALHLHRQVVAGESLRLFQGCDGYGDGEQRRDFVHVDDVVAVNLWLLARPSVSGVFNVGTGRSQPFNDLAHAVIDWHGHGEIEYVPFPQDLLGRYQSFTEADLTALRGAGFSGRFRGVEVGVRDYLDALHRRERGHGNH